MKQLFSTLFVVLFATSMMAQELGSSCENPIPVDKDYRATIDGPCEIWYTAYTYDLPLHVYFSPKSDNSVWGPEVSVDFTCVPGVYDDPKLDSLINMVDDYDVTFPLELLCDLVVRNGRNEWDLSVAKSYREQLAEFGIPYNLQAYIKVTYEEAGSVSLTPDTAFTSCMDNAHFFELGDSVAIEANDEERVFVANYSEWQEDSIQFVWTGAEPAKVYLAVQECDFAPSATNPFVWAVCDVAKDVPYKVQSQEMKDAIKQHANGGLYYVKVVSSSAGKLLVEKIPMKAAQGGAQVLALGQEIQVQENALYCFPKSWTAAQFVAFTTQPVAMYVSNTADFTATDTDANVLDVFAANQYGNEQIVYLSSVEIADLAEQATDEYIYVRFSCPASTVIAIDSWEASACAGESYMIRTNEATRLVTNTFYKIYRLRYSDIQGTELTIKWTGNGTVTPYISDTCSFLFSEAQYLLLNPAPTIRRRGSYTVTAAEINAWESRVGEDGYIFMHLDATSAGNITFAVEKPVLDPINTTITETLCYGESYEWNGQVYATTGEYTQNFTAANGADSIVTLKLTILPEVAPTTEEATIEAGETYTWNGKEYSEAGEYTITLQDKNGCDYQATLVLKVNEPLSPCLQSSIKLNVGDEVVINLDSAFTVYAIDYAAWMAQPVTLVWTGAEALHTFVAETCVFALAPYNKYVHAYVPVPAQGDSALDMEALAPYVDADGYLYVRFLTEFEGTLKVGQ